MYINFEEFKKSGLSSLQFMKLIAIKNKYTEFLDSPEGDDLSILFLLSHGFISELKKSGFKLTDKGKELLKNIKNVSVDDDDKVVFDWLKSFYIKNDKKVGNEAKTLRYIFYFKKESGIERNNLIILCKEFLKDDENMNYNHVLEYAFYKPSNVYSTTFKLEDSRLYQYYLNRKDYFDTLFKK